MCDSPNCASTRILEVSAKCSDMFNAAIGPYDYDGYVLSGMNIGGGDYVEFNVCLDCGKLQGKFPVEIPEFANDKDEE